MKQMTESMMGSLKLTIHEALWGKVIPSLRGIILDWKSDTSQTTLLFFHNGEITEAIRNHYVAIYNDVRNNFSVTPPLEYKIIRCDAPKLLPKQNFVIYIRREPFENPTDLDSYGLK